MGPKARALDFCRRLNIKAPIFLAPMAGSSPPALSVAVARAGGFGACGALALSPGEIADWATAVRAAGVQSFQLNLWTRDPPPGRDEAAERLVGDFLSGFGPTPAPEILETPLQSYEAQLQAVLDARPPAASSIMGLFPASFVSALKAQGGLWFATVTTVRDALAAERAGADVLIAQGAEAGGHRGAFTPSTAADEMVGLAALVPAVVDAVRTPVIAAGGLADGRGVAAALALGASGAMIGTGFLRCPEAGVLPAWSAALARATPETTRVTRVFTGRPARSLLNAYVEAATSTAAPAPLPYPLQRAILQPMQSAARRAGDASRLQMWAGQSAGLAKAQPAGELLSEIWADAAAILA